MTGLRLGKIRHNLSPRGAAIVREAWRTPSSRMPASAMEQALEYGRRMLALRGITLPPHAATKWEPVNGDKSGFVRYTDGLKVVAEFPITAQPDQFKIHADHNGDPADALPIIPRKRTAKPRQVTATAPLPVPAPSPAPLAPTPSEAALAGKVFWFKSSRGRMFRTQVPA